jgi:hypothetical protein
VIATFARISTTPLPERMDLPRCQRILARSLSSRPSVLRAIPVALETAAIPPWSAGSGAAVLPGAREKFDAYKDLIAGYVAGHDCEPGAAGTQDPHSQPIKLVLPRGPGLQNQSAD